MANSLEEAQRLMDSPLHGNQGDRDVPVLRGPLGPALAISRQAGSRGESIARRVAKKMGWDVYTRDLLDYMAQNDTQRERILAEVPLGVEPWVQAQILRLQADADFSSELHDDPVPQLLISLAARGNVVFVGRGAGYILPKTTTLHVRIVAPLENRVAYMAQYLRLGKAAALEQVQKRDSLRVDFLNGHYSRRDGQDTDFDMILNSAELGEPLCAEIIVTALRSKQQEPAS